MTSLSFVTPNFMSERDVIVFFRFFFDIQNLVCSFYPEPVQCNISSDAANPVFDIEYDVHNQQCQQSGHLDSSHGKSALLHQMIPIEKKADVRQYCNDQNNEEQDLPGKKQL